MSLFKSRQPVEPTLPKPAVIEDKIPVAQLDLTKRYDVHCFFIHEDRLYEDVRIVGVRTLERMTEYSTGLIGGYIEIEAADSTRALIPLHHIQVLCEHGAQPTYKVLRRWTPPEDSSVTKPNSQ